MEQQGNFTEEMTRFYSAEIFLVLSFIHRKHIIYRDLKPENILLNRDGHIKITDFGLAKELKPIDAEGKTKTKTFCGTAEYLAPEIIKCEEYDFSVDYWSLGILIYEMLTGNPPFMDKNRKALFQKILNDEPDLSILPDSAKSLIKGMLSKKIKERLKPDEIKNHPFYQGIDFDKLLAKEVKPPFIPEVVFLYRKDRIVCLIYQKNLNQKK